MDETSYEIASWSMGDDGFDLGVRMHGKRFRIAVWAEYFKDSPSAKKSFQRIFDMMNDGEDDREELWDYLEWIADHFLDQFQSLAPPVLHSGKLTLARLAVRDSFECEFHVVQEKPNPGPVTRLVEDDFEELDARTLETSFPMVNLADVEVPYDNASDIFSIIPQRVLVHGQSLFYKSSVSIEATREEIAKYDKIAASGLLPSDLRTSRLYAIVIGSRGGLRGLIFHFIKAEERLTWAVDERTPLALREKWAAQIKDTVARLHGLGIAWGDVKADNVLIDEEKDAIVIDLEGGTTQDWVDKEKEGTIAGDLLGLERMMDFIFNDASVLRPPPLGPDDEPIVKLRGY